MTFIYTPPEPSMRLHGKRGKQITPEAMDWYTLDQLRSEVERVRRETVEECSEFLAKMPAPLEYGYKDASFFDVGTMYCSEVLIRELLK